MGWLSRGGLASGDDGEDAVALDAGEPVPAGASQLAADARALGSTEGDRGRGALGKAAVDSDSAHSQLGSGLSLPGGHPAAVRECGACWLVP